MNQPIHLAGDKEGVRPHINQTAPLPFHFLGFLATAPDPAPTPDPAPDSVPVPVPVPAPASAHTFSTFLVLCMHLITLLS